MRQVLPDQNQAFNESCTTKQQGCEERFLVSSAIMVDVVLAL